MSTEVLLVIAALGGSFLAALLTFLITVVSTRSQERQRLRESLIQAALEEWKMEFKAIELSKKGGVISPLYRHMATNLKLIPLFQDKMPSDKKIMTIIEDAMKVDHMVMEYVIKHAGTYRLPADLPQYPPPK